MENLRAQILRWAEKFDALSARERALSLIAASATILFGWDKLFYEPAAREAAQIRQEMAESARRLEVATLVLDGARAGVAADPNAAVRERLANAQTELENLRGQQARLVASFLPADRMVDLLRGVLSGRPGLTLISLRSLPVRKLDKEGNKTDGETPAVYRHEMSLELEGGYFDILDYVRSLEGHALFWESLDYGVQVYPTARVRLNVYTLSLEKEWLIVGASR